MDKRIHYVDNLRWLTVSLLVIYHAAMAYNTWGEANYIFFEAVGPIAGIVSFISPWFMPLMFLLAGVSTFYSLKKRTFGAFLKERLLRLGIPILFGLLFINPILSYVADVTHNGFDGNFFAHYGIYFTRFTDLSGYDGGFTLGHLWFITMLLVVSLIGCCVIKLLAPLAAKDKSRAMNVIGIVFAVIAVATFEVKLLGKPLIVYIFVYLLGYYFFSSKEFVDKLSRLKWLFTPLFLICSCANVALFIFIRDYEVLNNVCSYLSFVTGILALITIGHDHLDFESSFTRFNSKISYVFYITHFPIVVLCQYFLSIMRIGIIANFALSVVISYPLTYLVCALIEKSRYVRVVFGLKKML